DNGFLIDKLPEIPAIFKEIRKCGQISWHEMFKTFNMGIGMVVILSSADEEKARESLPESEGFAIIGRIVEKPGIEIKDFEISLE
ncbi:MAG: AIR synthase-related protein, partial [Candidatus Hodarchaeales archaeon]